MSKIREKAVCLISAEEAEAWQQAGTAPDCTEHRHMSEREARLLVYPWQCISSSESAPVAKIVGQHKGRVCIQMIAAQQWQARSKSFLPAEAGMGYLAITTQQLRRV
jgi:hypothetical protein